MRKGGQFGGDNQYRPQYLWARSTRRGETARATHDRLARGEEGRHDRALDHAERRRMTANNTRLSCVCVLV